MAISKKHSGYRITYRQRVLGSLVIVLILIQSVIELWPDQADPVVASFMPEESSVDLGFIESVQITHQYVHSLRPVPSKPEIPLYEPLSLEPVLPDLSEILDVFMAYSLPLSEGLVVGSNQGIVARPDQPAVPIRIVEPELANSLPEQIRGKIRVEFILTVYADGTVESVQLEKIDFPEFMDVSIDLSTIEAQIRLSAIQAATQWTFRPAQNRRNPVKSFYRSSFRF